MSEINQCLTKSAHISRAVFGAGSYAITNGYLYFNSGNHLPKKIGLANDPAITYGNVFAIFYVAILFSSSLILSIANLNSYLSRIKEAFPSKNKEENNNNDSKKIGMEKYLGQRLTTSIIYWSSAYKTIITNCAILTLINRCSFTPALIVSLLLTPGNFFTQFAFLSKETHIKINNWVRRQIGRDKMSFVLSICYAATQAALYFDALDALPKHLYEATNGDLLFDDSLITFKNSRAVLIVFLIIMTIILSYSNLKTFNTEIIENLKPDQDDSLQTVNQLNTSVQNQIPHDKTPFLWKNHPQKNRIEKGIAWTSSLYKSFVACSSFFTLSLGMVWPSLEKLTVLSSLTLLLLVGNVVSQYAIFKKKEEESEADTSVCSPCLRC